MLRAARPLNLVALSPTVRQRAAMRAPECLPLIFEPGKSNNYGVFVKNVIYRYCRLCKKNIINESQLNVINTISVVSKIVQLTI